MLVYITPAMKNIHRLTKKASLPMNLKALFRRTLRRKHCTVEEIRIMRAMRFNGYALNEIALNVDRTPMTVWNHTKDVTNSRWMKDRIIMRPRKGGHVELLSNAEYLMA